MGDFPRILRLGRRIWSRVWLAWKLRRIQRIQKRNDRYRLIILLDTLYSNFRQAFPDYRGPTDPQNMIQLLAATVITQERQVARRVSVRWQEQGGGSLERICHAEELAGVLNDMLRLGGGAVPGSVGVTLCE